METVTKKTISIEFGGKKHALSDDVTIGAFLSHLGLPEDIPVKMVATRDGFLLIPQV